MLVLIGFLAILALILCRKAVLVLVCLVIILGAAAMSWRTLCMS